MLRNVASQRWRVYAWDTTTGLAKTGDAANISAYITIDDGTPGATNDAAPTEIDATNEPGYYEFNLLQAETNGAKLSLSPKSSTANISAIACPPVAYTVPQYHSLLGINSSGHVSRVTLVDTTTANSDMLTAVAIRQEIDSNSTQLAAISLDTGTNLPASIAAISSLDAAGVRAAIGLASANLDTQLASIKIRTDMISTGNITVVSPVSTDGETITIVRGDDYKDADGRALSFSSTAWPDLTGATLAFTATKGASSITGTVTGSSVGGATQTVKVELDAADTEGLNVAYSADPYLWDIEATLVTSANVVTLATGTMVVVGDVS